MAGIRLAVPSPVHQGEIIEIKALIQHAMESGFRRGARGEVIERNILTRFECDLNGTLIFAADLHPGVAANPLITFHLKAMEPGTLTFTWTDQHGEIWQDSAALEIT
ncbi:MAG: thiosulfate oxidation carrier complex protein SoxZ [Pseudomonadota bacterium]